MNTTNLINTEKQIHLHGNAISYYSLSANSLALTIAGELHCFTYGEKELNDCFLTVARTTYLFSF